MQPLKVTAELAGPVSGPPMLDALLERCMLGRVGRDLGKRHVDSGHGDLTPGLIPSPVARRTIPGFPHPVPCCSSPIFCAAGETVNHITRRASFDPLMLAEQARTIHYTTMGEFKSYRLPLAVQMVDRVVWFCVGDLGDIRRLLKTVLFVGKKRSIGYGAVATWIVEPITDDWSWVAPSDAGPVLMRPLPTGIDVPGGLLGCRRWFGGMTPPYWASEHFAEGVIPC